MINQSFQPTFLRMIGLLLLATSSVNAVEAVRVSDHGNGVQLWFEAEDYDERNPDDETNFALSDEAGAFGRSITSLISSTVSRGAGGNGNIRYDFNLKDAEGKGGTWYFWGRVINPRSNSDALLVDGHPGDPTPVTSPEPPPGLEMGDLYNHVRIFEQAGPADEWFWAPGSAEAGEEGHTKQLRDGENTMWIVSKEGGAIWDVLMWTDDPDYVPTDEDYAQATAPVRGRATSPIPANNATDVSIFLDELNWNAGEFATTHDVYYGTDFTDVNSGAANVLVSGGQSGTSFAVTPELETTYFWRVDAVNGGVIPGKVWNFTTEPVGRPIPAQSIVATASSHSTGNGPEKTIDGSGLGPNDLHSNDLADMWLSEASEPNEAWIQYDFNRPYKLHQMLVWNLNGPVIFSGYGLRDVAIAYSSDGIEWVEMDDTFARAPGTADYSHIPAVEFGGAVAKMVRIAAKNNWGSGPAFNLYGLSEVRFLAIPVSAHLPMPESGTTDVALDTMLSWRAGRGAAEHTVYVSSDEQSVAEGTAPAVTVSETSYGPLSLDLGSTYYWSVDAINEAMDPSVLTSDIWSFSTLEYFVVDDFEDYNDFEPDEVWRTWIDGYDDPTNGSTAGYPEPDFEAGEHYVETGTVHSDGQSMPLLYDNTGNVNNSEVTRTFDTAQDWTRAGINTLTLYVYGQAGNAGGQLYVKVNGIEKAVDVDLTSESWQELKIELGSFGVNLQRVTSLAISIRGAGSGMVFVDDVLVGAPLE